MLFTPLRGTKATVVVIVIRNKKKILGTSYTLDRLRGYDSAAWLALVDLRRRLRNLLTSAVVQSWRMTRAASRTTRLALYCFFLQTMNCASSRRILLCARRLRRGWLLCAYVADQADAVEL